MTNFQVQIFQGDLQNSLKILEGTILEDTTLVDTMLIDRVEGLETLKLKESEQIGLPDNTNKTSKKMVRSSHSTKKLS